jgi:hypothetical protein
MGRWRNSLFGDEGGVAAIEFAFVAPILVFACLATADLGLAINKKMELDDSLRVVSEGAMGDLGEDEVQAILDAVASENFETDVERFCTCPEDVASAVDCDSGACAGAEDPYLYYRLSGEMEYATFLLPNIPISASLLVQVE